MRPRVGGLDPAPPPPGARARRGSGGRDGARTRGSRGASRTCDISPGAACSPVLPSRPDEAVPGQLRLLGWLYVKFEGQGRCVLPLLGFVRLEGFSVEFPRVMVCPPPTTGKAVPQGHFSKTRGVEKHAILENLVNSTPIECPLF